MKSTLTFLFLMSIIVVESSFKKHGHAERFKNEGYLIAVVDGKMFELRDDNKYTASLANKAGDIYAHNNAENTKLTRVANVLNFYGNDFQDASGNMVSENIAFEYAFKEGALGEAGDHRLVLNFNGQKYYNMTAESKFTVSKLDWSSDRRYFVMNAEFDCKMRRWGMPATEQPTLRLKGKMVNINVDVPSWIVLKNPNQTAEER